MPKLTVIHNTNIPPGTKVTPCALMPKVLCCIEAGINKVFVGNKKVRTFRHAENALKKMTKINHSESVKATKILTKLNNPTISPKTAKEEENIGFDNVI